MQAYSEALSAGLREARERIAKGSLDLSLVGSKRVPALSAVAIRNDEQEYALKQRLAHAQRRIDALHEVREFAEGDQVSGGIDESESDGDSDESSIRSARSSVKSKRKRQRTGSRPGKQELKKAVSELEFQSTRAFLLTLQHKDSEKADSRGDAGFRGDGALVSNDSLPLPIPVEMENVEALEAMLEQLGYLSGLTLISVEQTRLASVHQTAWVLRGQPSCDSAEASRAQSKVRLQLEFVAKFNVDEQTNKLSALEIDVTDVAWVEAGRVLLHCQDICCLRSFCEYYTQYCELYLAREQLFSSIELAHSGNAQVATSAQSKGLPFKVLSRVLEVTSDSGEMLWLVWEPYFKLQRRNEEDKEEDENDSEDDDDHIQGGHRGKRKAKVVHEKGHGQILSEEEKRQIAFRKDETFKNVREGYSLRTRIELWRRKSSTSQCLYDENFAFLVQTSGLSAALKTVVKAMLP